MSYEAFPFGNVLSLIRVDLNIPGRKRQGIGRRILEIAHCRKESLPR